MLLAHPVHIGCILFHTRLSFWAILSEGIQSRAIELGHTATITPCTTPSEQITMIDQCIQQGLDALIIGPIESEGLGPAIRRAQAAGMPVILVDSGISDAEATCTVVPDNYQGSAKAAELLIERCGGQGAIAHIHGPLLTQTAKNRCQGFRSVVDQQPQMPLVFEAVGDWSRQSGHRLMHEALAAHPDLRAVFTASDGMALGAVAAIKEANRTGNIVVVGFDGIPDSMSAIKTGKLAATMNQAPRLMGQTALDATLAALRGESVEREILIPVRVLDASNVLDAALDAVELLPSLLEQLSSHHDQQHRFQQEVIAVQRRLIQELSSPIIPINDQILVLPLIGTIDSHRAQQIMETMLNGISARRAHTLIIDITGVAVVDTHVSQHLIQAARAAQLLGTTVIIVGITPNVAQTIVQLGVDLSSIITRSDLQTGIEYAMSQRKHVVGARTA